VQATEAPSATPLPASTLPPVNQPEIRYRHGLAVVRHVSETPPGAVYDPRADAYVAPGHRLPEIREWAAARGIVIHDAEPDTLAPELFDPRKPREYQSDAVARWLAAGGRGSVVLPTGAGKSFVAILAIHRTGAGACVVAPTRALLAQWFGQLADAFGAERVGAYYGDEKDVRPITVTTYHSAFALLERWGSRFDLLVLDEAHHLCDAVEGGGRAWHDALQVAPASRRLGLTATYPDGQDSELIRLVGPVVYRRTVGEMADGELAGFALQRRFVHLSAEERARYDAASATYESFIEEKAYRDRYPDAGDAWKVFMAETRRSPAARRAAAAFRERERIVALPGAKLREAARLLRLFPAEQAILFCGDLDAAERVSRHFAVPLVSAGTPASERKQTLDAIASGEVRAVASVRVLDEGWDVPSAKLGIVLGDSSRGSPRQHAQRLGRLLRRQGDRVATLFEIVVADTHEFYASQKRKKGLRASARRQLGLGF
jgi:superfamily II DNA or RNA helicase